MKKVAIYLPVGERTNPEQRTGFFTKKEVTAIERELTKSRNVSFVGNIDFNNASIINGDIVCDGINLSKVDLFFWHAPGMLKNIRQLQLLSQHTKIIKHPTAFEITSDKLYAHSILQKYKLPVADFAFVKYNDIDTMKKIHKKWKTVLVKPRLGSYGRGIIKVSDFETLRDITGMRKLETNENYIYLERYYENDISNWISTTMINQKVVYGYRKKTEKIAGWKVYDIEKKGGSAYYVDPKPVIKIAEQAAHVLNDHSIIGFDFIKTEKGYIIVDENNFPGLYDECFDEIKQNISSLITKMILDNV